MTILKYFPLETPRKGQVAVLEAIEQAFKDGYRNVLLEAPVGSGKSAIAVAVSKYFGSSHVLTPRKTLQNQYFNDFGNNSLVMMKGRAAYPCTYPSSTNQAAYSYVIKEIKKGGIVQPTGREPSCSEGPCLSSRAACLSCTGPAPLGGSPEFPCPYHEAIVVAQQHNIVVHNLHSFIFQAYFANRFEERPLLVVDECHELEGIIRGFASKSITIPKKTKPEDLPVVEQYKTLDDWVGYFEQFANLFSNRADKFGVTEKERFEEALESLNDLSEKFGENYVVEMDIDSFAKKTVFKFTPEQVGSLVNTLLLNYGKKRLLMSGTIYNKALFCKNNGLSEKETCFIRIGSGFPKETRPIYLKESFRLDTSHKLWDQNFSKMISNIKEIFKVFDDAKGLIHTPSYQASLTIYNALKSTGRVVMHNKDDFVQVLEDFYKEEEPKVLLSPICQQGVDFKYERARFQIIVRVPYLNTSDKFVAHKVEKDFSWYNYQALVLFGQQIGRINRSEDDFGATILLDDRFGKFIAKNRNILPKWLLEAIIYK